MQAQGYEETYESEESGSGLKLLTLSIMLTGYLLRHSTADLAMR